MPRRAGDPEKAKGLAGAQADVRRLRLGLEGTWRGLEAGGGALSWSHPASGVSVEVSARGVLTHESSGFRDRGVAGSLAWDPGGGCGRGPLAGLAANDEGDALERRQLELTLGYGFAVFGDRLTATPQAGLGLSNGHREYRLGWRVGLARSGPVSMELGLDATRREAANDDAEPVKALTLRGALVGAGRDDVRVAGLDLVAFGRASAPHLRGTGRVHLPRRRRRGAAWEAPRSVGSK